jgi:multidrug efflux pump subunit AcrA (membrane-fusion protein)
MPPIRSSKDKDMIWNAVQDGKIDSIGTDHVANRLNLKLGGSTVWDALAGFPGMGTMLPILLSEGVNKGKITLQQLANITSTNTAKIFEMYPKKGIIQKGSDADIVLAEFPGERFPGKLVTTSNAINVTTRTLLAEIDVPNPTDTLLTGSYAEVHLKIPSNVPIYLLPVNTLIFRSSSLQVGVVKDGRVTITDVTPGHDLGQEIEIVAGLKPDDQVVVNPPDSLVTGQMVDVVHATLPGDGE